MPDLTQEVVSDLTRRLKRFLVNKGGFGEPKFLAAGGSAAVFKVEGGGGVRAYKVFDPKFVNYEAGSAERHRLVLQERLIGHACESLVDTFSVDFAEDTAFVEMEFVEWPQLKSILSTVPDASVHILILQLVSAVQFLESLNMVHRDIKPENIHVSPDFSRLKLLDLGVIREFDPGPDAAETDHGNLRLFLATAQYSSPEYLFRLDQPSMSLWQALNFYQVGAVLHDLIMKEALFQSEISTGNRWLVAKAVLSKAPMFIDGDPGRLASLKALAQKCLTKDMDLRLKIVEWEDFTNSSEEALVTLRNRLKGRRMQGEAEHLRKTKFDREQFKETLTMRVRESLIAVCKTDLPLKVINSSDGQDCSDFMFDFGLNLTIGVRVLLHWQADLELRTAVINLLATIQRDDVAFDFSGVLERTICCASIEAGVQEVGHIICTRVADVASSALDVIDSCGNDVNQLDRLVGIDLQR